MSKELEPAATGKSGRRGNEIFWTHPTKSGIIVARAVSARTIKLDAERKPHAVAFGSIGHLSRKMIKAIRLGFPPNIIREKGATLFIRINLKNGVAEGIQNDPDAPVSKNKKASEEFHAEIHFDRLLVANGELEGPDVTVAIDKESRMLTFTQTENFLEGTKNEENDRIYAVIYETKIEACIIRELRQRKENGMTSVSLPERYDLDQLAIYTFATSRRGDQASNSQCLQTPKNKGE